MYISCTSNDIVEGIIKCLEKCRRLVRDVEILLANKNDYDDVAHAVGLYTYAIEELAKANILKESRNNGQLNIDETIFGGPPAHKKKFEEAIKILPPECFILHRGAFAASAFGEFADTKDIEIDWQSRFDIFYTDYERNSSKFKWKHEPEFDYDLVKLATEKLKEVVDKFNF